MDSVQRAETERLAAALDAVQESWPYAPDLASKLVLLAAQCGHASIIRLLDE